jgi:hypothetical protein
VPDKELQHARQLLAKYQAAFPEDDAPAAAGKPARSASGSKGGGGTAGGGSGSSKGDEEAGPESWAGEGYEPTQLRGVVQSYVKFSKRAARQQLQCARCAGGAAGACHRPPPEPPGARGIGPG